MGADDRPLCRSSAGSRFLRLCENQMFEIRMSADYVLAFDAAIKAAGAVDGEWNTRFREALIARGLKIDSYRPCCYSDRYPLGYAFQAPACCEHGKYGWDFASYIVWKAK